MRSPHNLNPTQTALEAAYGYADNLRQPSHYGSTVTSDGYPATTTCIQPVM